MVAPGGLPLLINVNEYVRIILMIIMIVNGAAGWDNFENNYFITNLYYFNLILIFRTVDDTAGRDRAA